jgi:hypothetical protein
MKFVRRREHPLLRVFADGIDNVTTKADRFSRALNPERESEFPGRDACFKVCLRNPISKILP